MTQAVFRPGGAGHLMVLGDGLGFTGQPSILRTVVPDGRAVIPADVPAVMVPMGDALPVLAAMPPADRWRPWQRPGDSVLAWSVAAKLALEHVAAGRLVPVVDGWRLVPDDRFAALARVLPPAAYALRRDERTVWSPDELLAAFGDAVAGICAVGRLAEFSADRADEIAAWAGLGAVSLRVQLHNPVGDGPWLLTFHPGEHDAFVRTLAEAARLFPPIDAVLSQRNPQRLALTAEQAMDFLVTGAAALTAAGIEVVLPEQQRLTARLRGAPETPDLDAPGLTTFHWEAAIGDQTLSQAEFDELAARNQPLVRWRDTWVRIDAGVRGKLGKVERMTSAGALSAALAGDVQTEGPLRKLVDELQAGSADREPRLDGVAATLRDYQRRGVAWLQAITEHGFGALLADDMGLGKTLQTIALLAGRPTDRPQLVVCPTSVLGNWERELARFAPGLTVVRHHGPSRGTRFEPGAIVVTSYALLRIDTDLLSEVDWDLVVLDEAQQIKNQSAQAARAAARLPCRARVALTGTPVENRLAELWSIMHFVNPGLLGTFTQFKQRYVVPVERWRDPVATRKLRAVIAPFLLRRMKSDVADDLPAKVESIVACTLTREQAALYQATVRESLAEGFGAGIQRSGRILKLLTALKQICNGRPGQSGKLTRATEMLGEAVAAGDRALVFTQYRVMADMLAAHLTAELDLPSVPVLHGGVPVDRRERMVEAFQTGESASPLLVISLKAGGVGLNLTRATHVLHYDRWWNPAVEDQATDRAHRIGQTRGVNVYKLVTRGTLEERIADLLERKRALADAVVGTGEGWVTELADDDLRALVELEAE